MRCTLMVVACFPLLASAACADVVTLYNANGYLLFGSNSVGKDRSQHFSPTTASNPLAADVMFNQAGFVVNLSDGETLGFTLSLKPWLNDYATSAAGTAIASQTFQFTGGGENAAWLSFSNQSAAGQYLLNLHVNNYSAQTGDVGWELVKAANDPNAASNDAWNDGGIKNDREYQVYLNTVAVPEPASISVLGLGLAALIRRRIKK